MPRRRTRHRPPDRCYPAFDDRVSSRFVRLSSGLRVRAVECGPADGPPVVLLPGWGASAFIFRHQLPALGAAGYRATAVDLKGHGFSDKPTGPGEYTFAAMLRHAEEVIDAVSDRPAAIVGQSMTGPLALDLALSRRAQIAKLVLVSPVGIGFIPFIRLAQLLTPRLLDPIAPYLVRRIAVRVAVALAYGDPTRVTRDIVEEYWAPAQFPDFARALRALVHDFDWSPLPAARLAAVDVPTLLIRGTRDRLVRGPPRHATTGLGGMRLVVIDGGGHAMNEELPGPANAAIVDFLRSSA